MWLPKSLRVYVASESSPIALEILLQIGPCAVISPSDLQFIFHSSIIQSDALNNNRCLVCKTAEKCDTDYLDYRSGSEQGYKRLWHAPIDTPRTLLQLFPQSIRFIYQLWSHWMSWASVTLHHGRMSKPLTLLMRYLIDQSMCLHCPCICMSICICVHLCVCNMYKLETKLHFIIFSFEHMES